MKDIKNLLLDATVSAVSRYGIEGASTRNVATLAGVCDSNIYKFFSDKDDLLYCAFVKSSSCLFNVVKISLGQSNIYSLEDTLKASVELIFSKVWNYLLQNKDVCYFHVYYRNSMSFNSGAKDYEYRQLNELISPVAYLFRNKTEAYMCIMSVLQLVYMFAQKVLDETLQNTKQTAERVLFQVLEMLKGYSTRRMVKEP